MEVLNPQVSNYIGSYYEGSSGEMEEFRTNCEKKHIPLIKRDTESFLINLLTVLKPDRILEIGTGAGYSAAVFAKTCENAKVTTLEMIESRIEAAKENFKKHGVADRVTLIEGDASLSLERVIAEMKEYRKEALFDLVFIDCAKSRYQKFFESSVEIIRPGGVIICDNVLLDGRSASDDFIEKRRDKTSTKKMREFVEFLKENKRVSNTSLLNIGDGLTLSVV